MFILSYTHRYTDSFFCDCHFSKNIWSELEKLILAKSGYDIVFTKSNIMFGFQGSNNKAMNCLSFIVKRTLYNDKLHNKVPCLPHFKSSIINYYRN